MNILKNIYSLPPLLRQCTKSVRINQTAAYPTSKPPLRTRNPPLETLLGQYPASASLIGIGGLSVPGTSDRPSVLLTLSVITGLPILLWAYKSAMLYLFQRKIIYMGYVPPGARTEELGRDVPARLLRDIKCEEVSVQGEKKIKLAGLVLRPSAIKDDATVDTVIVYFQGNAGNPLHRIPLFQTLLRPSPFPFHLNPSASQFSPPNLAILAVAPRSYWKSSASKPTQRGLTSDYAHVLSYAVHRWPRAGVIIYGHSLGASVATCLLAELRFSPAAAPPTSNTVSDAIWTDPLYANIQGLILENPFSSIPAMTRALYPEKWTPYHHMGPLVWDAWDAVGAITAITAPPPSQTSSIRKEDPDAQNPMERGGSVLERLRDDTMLLLSEHDEMVPREMGEELWTALHPHPQLNSASLSLKSPSTSLAPSPAAPSSRSSLGAVSPKNPNNVGSAEEGIGIGRKVIIADALHENAWQRRQWLREMTRYVGEVHARCCVDGR